MSKKKIITLILWVFIIINVLGTLLMKNDYHTYKRLEGIETHFLCNGTIKFLTYTSKKDSCFSERILNDIVNNKPIFKGYMVGMMYTLKRISSMEKEMALMAKELRNIKFENMGKEIDTFVESFNKELNLQKYPELNEKEWYYGSFLMDDNSPHEYYTINKEHQKTLVKLFEVMRKYDDVVHNYLEKTCSYVPVEGKENMRTVVYNIDVESDEWIEFLKELEKLNGMFSDI